jgi:dynein heavy chain 1
VQIFNDILRINPNLESIKDFDKRLEILLRDLFAVSFSRCSRSLLHVDHLTFALRLAQIKLRLSADEEWDEREFDSLLRGSEGALTGGRAHPDFEKLISSFGEIAASDIIQLTYQPAFKDITSQIVSNISDWQQLSTTDAPEERISMLWKREDKCKY